MRSPLMSVAAAVLLSATTAAARSEQFEELVQYVANIEDLNLDAALGVVNGLEVGAMDAELTVNDRPYLHHLFDVFMRSESATDKKKAMELAYKSIEKGSDVSMIPVSAHYEPDLVYKSVYIRNMTLAHVVVDRLRELQEDLLDTEGAGDDEEDEDEKLAALTTVDTFQLLYTLSCDPVPLAKMLLHANTIVRQKVRQEMLLDGPVGSEDSAGAGTGENELEQRIGAMTELIQKLLSSASLVDTSSKFSFSGRELGAFSSAYSACIRRLVVRNYEAYNMKTKDFDDHGRNDVSLSELMNILQEMALGLHLSLFQTMGDVAFASELARLLASTNNKGRNILHMLSISHSEKILADIYEVLFKIVYESESKSVESTVDGEANGTSLVKEAIAELCSQVLNALVQRDVRGHSPHSLALTRFGKESPVVRVLMQIFFVSVTPTPQLLHQRVSMFDPGPELEPETKTENTADIVQEDFEMLAEILKLVDYLSSPLLPKPISAVRHIDFRSESDDGEPEPLTLANNYHRYYHWRQYTDQSVADLAAQWRSSLAIHGGWAEEVFALPANLAGAAEDGANAPLKVKYLDNFPDHNHNEVSLEEGVEERVVPGPDAVPQEERCDIEVVYLSELPTAEEFYWLYVNEGKPVVFRGVALNDTIRSVFSKDSFVRKYGQQRVPVATIPYANSFGVSSSSKSSKPVVATMADMASDLSVSSISLKNVGASASASASDPNVDADDKEYLYAFTTELSHMLRADIPVPSNIRNSAIDGHGNLVESSDIELQFYLGPAGSGAPMHVHGNALNTMAYGMKHWFLYPPSEAFYSTQPSAAFAQHDVRARESLQCTQYGGDVMFVPSLWGHATLNRKQSIGVAHEFSVESFCMQ